MLEECVSQLDEPFRHSEILGWFRRHYPDVKETTVAAHIYAATSNAANRAKNHPYLGRRPALLRRIDHGLYVRADRSGGQLADTSADARTGPITADDKQPRLRVRATDRARSNVEALVAGFASYLSSFQTGNPFSGPSVYFHQRAIERRRSHDSIDALLADQQFLEYVYAVLPAWGMHRMGSQRAKVTEYAQLVGSLRATAPSLRRLWPLNICDLEPDSVAEVSEQAWQVIAAIRASTSETQIVAGSKVLHHLLPDLIPPIDRQYTFRFFTGQKAVPAGDRQAFLEWFPYLAEIGRRCRSPIEAAMRQGTPMSDGRAKVIDNAIIGFMITKDNRRAARSSATSPRRAEDAIR
jgi:hypothetical protein